MLLKRMLEQRGHEVRILTLSFTSYSHMDEKEGVYYVGSVSAERVYHFARIRSHLGISMIRLIKKWGPDIVHSQCELTSFPVAKRIARECKVPLVDTYHTVYEDYINYVIPLKKLARPTVSFLSRYRAGDIDCIVVPTRKTYDLLRSYRIKKRIEIIPSGIDLSVFRKYRDPAEFAALHRKYGIPDNDYIVAGIGRIAKEKNIEEVIEDIASLGRSDITYLIVGDGPYRAEIEEKVRKSGIKAVFTGMIDHDELDLYYKFADVFVSASTSETQGLTYDEALASGTPCLCRADPCIEGVIINGVNGWQYNDRREFSEKLSLLLSDRSLLAQMSKNAAASADSFSAELFGKRVEQLYLDLIAENRAKHVK